MVRGWGAYRNPPKKEVFRGISGGDSLLNLLKDVYSDYFIEIIESIFHFGQISVKNTIL